MKKITFGRRKYTRNGARKLLQKIPGCEKVIDDVQQWMEKDKQRELTDHDIALVNLDDNEDDEDNEAGTGLGLHKMERMSHSIGVKPLLRGYWLTLNNKRRQLILICH
jgi:hypothetical protein